MDCVSARTQPVAHAQPSPHTQQPVARRSTVPPGTIEVGLTAFGAFYVGVALFMAVAPHTFFKVVGPFETLNVHYMRDTATFSAGIGMGLLVAVRRPSWRVPALAIATLQSALHSINHLIDIDRAHPVWIGYVNFFSLAVATLGLAWLLRVVLGEEEPTHPHANTPEGARQ